MLRKRWKPKTAMLTLAVVGGVTFSVLTTITVLAQTSSDRSAISQSSAKNAGHGRKNVRSDRNNTSITTPDHTIVNCTENCNKSDTPYVEKTTEQSGAAYVEKATTSYTNKKQPIICRSRAIRTVLGWKCPKYR